MSTQPNDGQPNETPEERLLREKKEKASAYVDAKAKDENAALIKLLEKQFVRIGDNFYKRIHRGGKEGKEIGKDLLPLNKNTIEDICKGYEYFTYKSSFQYPEKHVPKFDCYGNEPNNSKSHTEKILIGNQTQYNRYHKITHVPKEGEWLTIEKHLLHIYGESHYEFALDLFRLMWNSPKVKTPAICLVSEEKESGKTSHTGGFLSWIFENNHIQIGNSDIAGNFNAHYSTKYIIAVDEVSLNTKDNVVKEKMNSAITDTHVIINGKNTKIHREEFYGRFFFTSNNVKTFMKLDEGETRYAVFEVPPINPADKINNFEAKIKKEIPAFLYYLENSPMIQKKSESRFYFPYSAYETEAAKGVQASTKDSWKNQIDSVLDTVKIFQLDQLEIPEKQFAYITYGEIDRIHKYKFNQGIKTAPGLVRDYLKTKAHFNNQPNQKHAVAVAVGFDGLVIDKSKSGRFYKIDTAAE